MAIKPPSNFNATGNSNAVSASKQPSGNTTDGTSVDTVFYPTLTFKYEKLVNYQPAWELTKACAPYETDDFKNKSKTRAALPVGHAFTETDRKVDDDKLYLKLAHSDGAGEVWIYVGRTTDSHKYAKDTTALKTFDSAKVTSTSWVPQVGYRGTVTLNYFDSTEKVEKDKSYNFITIGKLWKWVKSDSQYRWYGPMTRAAEATYAGYIMPRNKYANDPKKQSADKKYSGGEASRSIWVIWQYRESEWKQGVLKTSGNTTSNVFIHPASHFYHLEGCLAPCDADTALSDDGFTSYIKSEEAMDDIFTLAHGTGTTCTEPAKAADAKWYRIVVKDIVAGSESSSSSGSASGGGTATPGATGSPQPVRVAPTGVGGRLGPSPTL